MLNTQPSTASLKQSESALGGLRHPSNSGRVNTATLNVAICGLPGPRTMAVPIPRSCTNADGQSSLASLDYAMCTVTRVTCGQSHPPAKQAFKARPRRLAVVLFRGAVPCLTSQV